MGVHGESYIQLCMYNKHETTVIKHIEIQLRSMEKIISSNTESLNFILNLLLSVFWLASLLLHCDVLYNHLRMLL